MELDGLLLMAVLPPAVTLTFSPKTYQYISWLRHICDYFGEMSSNCYEGIVFTWFFLGHCLLRP